ncbi:hypothetical protein EG327_008215 [Venturia inaequalis]|uniref:Uncharacterized protein n=1 Tax=Venturia inaequalis TaxID=5025 RepID=A0A8H3Z151_VENIN|nr:hypothetical protein EG327_008215 [Venturia inaequalis]
MDYPFPHVFPEIAHPETDALLKRCIERAHGRLPAVSTSGLLPNDSILFLSQSLSLLDIVADSLVKSRQMKATVSVAVQQQELENDLSEMDSFDSLIETHAILRKVSRRIHEAARDVQSLWNEAPLPINPAGMAIHSGANVNQSGTTSASSDFFSTGGPAFPASAYSESRHHSAQVSYELPDPTQPQVATFVGGEGQSDDASAMANIHQWLDTLKSRGKGRFTCPYDIRCRKGGVGGDGNLVVFIRNSDFRSAPDTPFQQYINRITNMTANEKKTPVTHSRKLGSNSAKFGRDGGESPLSSQPSTCDSPTLSTERKREEAPVMEIETALEIAKNRQNLATGWLFPDVPIAAARNFNLKILESLCDDPIDTADQEGQRHYESFMLHSWIEEPAALDPTVWFSSATRHPEIESYEKPEDEVETTETDMNCDDGTDVQVIQEARDLHGDLMGIGAWSNGFS